MRRMSKMIRGLKLYSIGSRQWQEACRIADKIAEKPDDQPLTNVEAEALIVYLYGEEEMKAE